MKFVIDVPDVKGLKGQVHAAMSLSSARRLFELLETQLESEEGIPFTRESVRDYLDNAITRWRKVREGDGDTSSQVAAYYIDAYQSIRASLFRWTLK